ncbi:MAG: septal ring lytic transglycosylase RlpA family protein [Xanthomonadales bacterium]|nr:septal ring lytic transglycosylase RlpA family protein [Xanthomonadales bacterium]
MSVFVRHAGTLLAVLLLAACAAKPERPAPAPVPDDVDGPSTRPLSAAEVKDAVPRPEPRARYGNHSPYEVYGREYRVLPSSEGYRARGTASWYGRKFHGRRTSSGEPYDMHLATAAHRELPLPTYAEVTNLQNGSKVIVKINDRGPFVGDRLIDLSYGAALRLGMVDTGTAPVEVRAISFDEPQPPAPAVKVAQGAFLQVGAFRTRDAADQLAGRMLAQHLTPVSVQRGGGLYKVWVGPFPSEQELDRTARRIVELGYERPHTVTP